MLARRLRLPPVRDVLAVIQVPLRVAEEGAGDIVNKEIIVLTTDREGGVHCLCLEWGLDFGAAAFGYGDSDIVGDSRR